MPKSRKRVTEKPPKSLCCKGFAGLEIKKTASRHGHPSPGSSLTTANGACRRRVLGTQGVGLTWNATPLGSGWGGHILSKEWSGLE